MIFTATTFLVVLLSLLNMTKIDSTQMKTDMNRKKKTITLIRHAQSEENVKVIQLCDGLTRIGKFQPPTCAQVSSALSLLSFTIDSEVSNLGTKQITDMNSILKDSKFWEKNVFDLILCSPLIRARFTCEGVLPPEKGNFA